MTRGSATGSRRNGPARIRHCKSDENPLLLITEMESGHSGASAKRESLRETAREFAFIIDQLLTSDA